MCSFPNVRHILIEGLYLHKACWENVYLYLKAHKWSLGGLGRKDIAPNFLHYEERQVSLWRPPTPFCPALLSPSSQRVPGKSPRLTGSWLYTYNRSGGLGECTQGMKTEGGVVRGWGQEDSMKNGDSFSGRMVC